MEKIFWPFLAIFGHFWDIFSHFWDNRDQKKNKTTFFDHFRTIFGPVLGGFWCMESQPRPKKKKKRFLADGARKIANFDDGAPPDVGAG